MPQSYESQDGAQSDLVNAKQDHAGNAEVDENDASTNVVDIQYQTLQIVYNTINIIRMP